MKGIAEANMRTSVIKLFWGHALNRTVCAHRHKRWRFNYASVKFKTAAARFSVCVV